MARKILSKFGFGMEKKDFLIVTERGGEPVSVAQLERFYQRYIWAGAFCAGKDVLEMACGTGPGLGYLESVSRSLAAGDISTEVVSLAREHYGARVSLQQFDASAAPFPDASFDVVILFEAIYYMPDVSRFFEEARRLLRPSGVLLLATANKDLFDFNPSPFSHRYLNPPELRDILHKHGLGSEFFGGSPVRVNSSKAVLVRALKKAAVSLHLIPRSMKGKRMLKRLFLGQLVTMPSELSVEDAKYDPPTSISAEFPDTIHQVLYCVARKV